MCLNALFQLVVLEISVSVVLWDLHHPIDLLGCKSDGSEGYQTRVLIHKLVVSEAHHQDVDAHQI